MLEGKRFLPDTGMPILNMDRKMVLLAVELPEPFFVPTVIEKSFTTLFMELLCGYVIASREPQMASGEAIFTFAGRLLRRRTPSRNDMNLLTDGDTKGRYV